MVRVETGARLHFGFGNLSLAHERLYGAVGVAIDAPRTVVHAEPRDSDFFGDESDGAAAEDHVVCDDPLVREYAQHAVNILGVPGVEVTVESSLPRHVGLGSGTQLALATLTAVARAHGRAPAVRERAPALGRGGRSGVGVAAFERGGVVLDAGHPTARFTTERPPDGSWEVPPVAARHPVPSSWRFLLVRPDIDPGRDGEDEEASLRSVVESADPNRADRIAGVVTRRLLPAVADGSAEAFGGAVAEIGRLNGAWYAEVQGGTYRPPIGDVVDALSESVAVYGAGQSSWGPTVYGVTDEEHADAGRAAGREALDVAGVDGSVRVVRGRNRGAHVEE